MEAESVWASIYFAAQEECEEYSIIFFLFKLWGLKGSSCSTIIILFLANNVDGSGMNNN